MRAVLADIRQRVLDGLSHVADGGYERVSVLLDHYGSHPLFKSEAACAKQRWSSPDLAVASTPRAL